MTEMDDIFVILNRYFWVLALVVTALNGFIFHLRSRHYIQQNPALAPGYAVLVRGFVLYNSLPWIVMGIGILIGHVPQIWNFLYPRDGNLFIWAWWGSLWLLYLLGTYWILGRGGAEMLVTHPGFVRGNPKNATTIKRAWLFMLAIAVAVSIIVWTQPVPPPSPAPTWSHESIP